MLERFICPSDGVEIPIVDCLKECRLGKRCVFKAFLKMCSKTRPFTGKISATSALNGCRMNYLMNTIPYAVNPKKQIYKTIGTMSHSLMEDCKSEGELTETRYEDEWSTGAFDTFDPVTGILGDFKFPGSYAIKKCLGLCKIEVFSETEVYMKATTRHKGKENESFHEKGTPKVVERWYVDPSKVEDFEYAMQLNRYRIFLEERGHKVNQMIVQLTPRDFSTQTARMYGLDDPPYLHECDKIEDNLVIDFYKNQCLDLRKHLAEKTMPPLCNEREAWGGRRCEGFCDVAEFCPNNTWKNVEKED